MQDQDTERRQQGSMVEVDPFGCPYCGGPVTDGGQICSHCDRPLGIRQRKHPGGTRLNWLVLLFCLLGVAAWLEGYLLSQLVDAEPFPEWVNRTVLRFVFGPVLFSEEGLQDDLVDLAGQVIQYHNVLAGLCFVAAVGLALKSKVAYFGSFVLAPLLVVAIAAGLYLGLTGWVPAIVMGGLVAASTLWLADSASVFEWQIRLYNADVDSGLKTDLDYYHRGKGYAEVGMWAKAAAHWRVATRLSPNRAGYHAQLARAYAKMSYPDAARAEADRALALAPEDQDLRTFRDSLADQEAEH